MLNKLIEEIRTSGTDSLSHFGNNYTHEGGLFLQQNPEEFARLILILLNRKINGTYLEIGSASGGTALFLYNKLKFKSVLSIDDLNHCRSIVQDKHFGLIENCKRFVGDSHSVGAKNFLEIYLEDKIDFVFIDGDHSFEGVTKDIELVLPFCKKGSLIALHDIRACLGVMLAWLKLLETHKCVAEIIGNEKPLGIGVAEVI